MKKRTVILKIGGSVATRKMSENVVIRRTLLSRIAMSIRQSLERDPSLRLILLHGAGSAGHHVAKRFGLKDGTGSDTQKIGAALEIRKANQKLNAAITDILSEHDLRVAPLHTASCVVQQDGAIKEFFAPALYAALQGGFIPILYGEMVFDTTLGMSVCSGDDIAVTLAHVVDAEMILHASDIDGIFDKDPHKHPDAVLIRSTSLRDILSDKDVSLADSHHVDVTGGLRNKLASLCRGHAPESLRKVIVFNGLRPELYARALSGEDIGTVIAVK